MATSSVTHNFVLSDPESVKRLIDALDASASDRTSVHPIPGRELTDPHEIIAFMQKGEHHYV